MSKTTWNQSTYEKMIAGHGRVRRMRDARALAKVFALAEESPLFAEALGWARDHDIRFFIDRKAGDVLGYYTNRTGALGISPSALKDEEEAVATIVHEIRHAWQDYHGIHDNADSYRFGDNFILTALIEADAEAWGLLAGAQYAEDRPDRKTRGKQETIDILREHFLEWFDTEEALRGYGDDLSKDIGKELGLYKGNLPHGKYELASPKRKDDEETPAGLNYSDRQDFLRLGVSFSGGFNYLATVSKDTLYKQILRPGLADTFWGAAKKKQRKLVREIRKTVLREELGFA